MWTCRLPSSPWAKSLIHRYWGMPPMNLREEVTELAKSLTLAVADFKNHMKSCEDRARRDETLQTERHAQNTTRLNTQDRMLYWLLGLVFSLFLAVIAGLFALLSGHIK